MIERPTSDAGYLEAAARIIFMGGLNRQVVDGKWPGFRAAFYSFDPAKCAAMSSEDVDVLAQDDRVIRYKAKLQAVVDNAACMVERAQASGSFGAYVDGLIDGGIPSAARALANQFAYISEEGAKNWLYSTGYDIGPVTEKIERKYAPYMGA